MDPSNIPFNTLIVGLPNSGETQYFVNQLRGLFCGKFDYIDAMSDLHPQQTLQWICGQQAMHVCDRLSAERSQILAAASQFLL